MKIGLNALSIWKLVRHNTQHGNGRPQDILFLTATSLTLPCTWIPKTEPMALSYLAHSGGLGLIAPVVWCDCVSLAIGMSECVVYWPQSHRVTE